MKFLKSDENKFFLSINILLLTIGVSILKIVGGYSIKYILLLGVILIVVQMIHQKRRYDRVDKLIVNVEQLLHSKEFILMDNNIEGELAVLYDDIRKMSIKLREANNIIASEKIYLLDSMADISHQLKTPLTSVSIQLALLQDKDIDDIQRKKYISNIKRQIDRVNWLISSLLKISKMDAKVVEMKKDRFELGDLIGKIVVSLAVVLDIKNQYFEYSSQGYIFLECDYHWFLEGLSNIIKNCSEHTGFDGNILVKAFQNNIYTQITIEDDGVGIDDDDLPHIFERFYRGKDSDNTGTGIGLALAKMIINKNNGIIKVEKKDGAGSRFIIKMYRGERDGSS